MNDFIPGQRWISDAESHLGLGTVLRVDARSVMLVFLATGETRTYSKSNAPLTRVEFGPGDNIESHEGWFLTVEKVSNNKGILTYHGRKADTTTASLEESQLSNRIQLNKPQDRLLAGSIDASKWFELRHSTHEHAYRLAQSNVYGLAGPRTDLIPHQLYIAQDVGNRYAPRVLLADEVGLGKTIEAGMILHQQLLTERARRVLIVVPETLAHQWLVEMLRRFNLHFRLYDEERCLAIEESDQTDNPFTSDQLVLCTLGFFTERANRLEQATRARWDLLIVDEAHHLHWTPTESNIEYRIVEQLVASTKGVLLLTATPEQAGVASHFARLRLLDSARFPDLDQFIEEEKAYIPVASALESLINQQPLSKASRTLIGKTLNEGDNAKWVDQLDNSDESIAQTAREKVIGHLLDRHGTSRVIFRNTRSSVKGFPERKAHAYPLPLPDAYAEVLQEIQSTGVSEPQLLLSPELMYQHFDHSHGAAWHDIDPRVEWLAQTLKRLKNEKVLVITASAQTALDLEMVLRHKRGLRVAVFHEGLTIVERDRASVYFAQKEDGAQALVCSEIGSEGRNFQFAHHLVLFDLPWNPDLLEQRIGRLDRIGQTQTISIHIPYLEKCAQSILYRWYHDGLNAFEHTCPGGSTVFTKMKSALIQALHQVESDKDDQSDLIATTRAIIEEINLALQKGRDRLLEFQSYRPTIARQIQQNIQTQDSDPELQNYLEQIFDCFGIEIEDNDEHSYILRPAEHLQTSQIPGLPDDGMTITFNRRTALANDPFQFMTWEHPLTQNSIDMIATQEKGNSTAVTIKHPEFKAGSMMLEALFILEATANESLQISRYLPPSPIRVLIDGNGKNITQRLPHDNINASLSPVDANLIAKVIRAQATVIRSLVGQAREHAQSTVPALISASRDRVRAIFQTEIDRLRALHQINPNVRTEEIDFFSNQLTGLCDAAERATLRLDALRVIVTL